MPQPAISECVNAKLGGAIHSWSITAGESCPGKSHLCLGVCYARRGFFIMPSVAAFHRGNYEFSQTDEFLDWMIGSMRSHFVRIMRIHCAGDFYSVEYIRKWHRVATVLPRTTFFAYTRSWRIDDMLPELVKLGSLPNVILWWSIDRETGPAPLVHGIRRAYMAIDDVDASLAPDDCDLVFRDNHRTVMKKGNGVLVCPPENGVTKGITCSRCGICWDKQRQPIWQTSILPYIHPDSPFTELVHGTTALR